MKINDEPITLSKWTPKNLIEIWEPLYSENLVLINPSKVGQHNLIRFTKAKSLTGQYYLSGKTIRKYKKRSNGTAMMWVVPLSELRPLEITERDLRVLI